MNRIMTFGEIMLRLSPPDKELILQTPCFNVFCGGSEANVAVSLSNYGESVDYVTALPPDNPITEAIIRELRKFNVNTSFIRRSGSRVGLYYSQTGSVMRPSKVIYDRAYSAFSQINPGDFDWDTILKNVGWFHVTGITPAISQGTSSVTLEALKKCKEKGISVSCDLNYRNTLWKWGNTAKEVMPEIATYVDVLIGNEEDCQKCLGIDIDVDVSSGTLEESKYRELVKKVMTRFPNVAYLAISLRESISADHNRWSGMLSTKGRVFTSPKFSITHIVDRIGGGDSFAAGLIYGLTHFGSLQKTIDFAVGASVLKHTIHGDYNQCTLGEVFSLINGDTTGRVKR